MERHALKDAADWFVRLQDRRVNSVTREKFAEWLLLSPDHVAAYIKVTEIYGRFDTVFDKAASVRDLVAAAKAETSSNVVSLLTTELLTPLPELTSARNRRRVWGVRLSIAAALIAVSLIASWQTLPHFVHPHYTTQIGEQRSLSLPDGSLVSLNTDSDLTVDLSGTERRIALAKGEARFTVAKDSNRPFIVTTRHAKVRAVGTIFNVQIADERTAVSVIEGRIEVIGRAQMTSGLNAPISDYMKPLVLRTGEQAAFTPRGRTAHGNVPSIERVMAWPNGRLVFRDEPLADLVTDFNRYHRLPLIVADPELAGHRVNGTFDAYDRSSLIQFLERYEGVRVVNAPDGSQLLSRAVPSRKSVQ